MCCRKGVSRAYLTFDPWYAMHPSDKDVTTLVLSTAFYSLAAYETLVGCYESHCDIHRVVIVFIGNYFGLNYVEETANTSTRKNQFKVKIEEAGCAIEAFHFHLCCTYRGF